jgi:NADH:ubiquinone oxidoreductase subunit 2 (subunit N)
VFFKVGAAPSHFWICDVYEGSLINVSAFFLNNSESNYLLFALQVCFNCFFKLWLTLFFFIGSFGSPIGFHIFRYSFVPKEN